MRGLIGKKIGMTRVFDSSGKVIPVTILKAGPCQVIQVKTVEHLLSALAGLHINNCEILIDNIEVPILDGSSSVYVQEILKKGLKEQESEQNILEIVKPVKFKCNYGFLSSFMFLYSCKIEGFINA